jgi:hypothetical protein
LSLFFYLLVGDASAAGSRSPVSFIATTQLMSIVKRKPLRVCLDSDTLTPETKLSLRDVVLVHLWDSRDLMSYPQVAGGETCSVYEGPTYLVATEPCSLALVVSLTNCFIVEPSWVFCGGLAYSSVADGGGGLFRGGNNPFARHNVCLEPVSPFTSAVCQLAESLGLLFRVTADKVPPPPPCPLLTPFKKKPHTQNARRI